MRLLYGGCAYGRPEARASADSRTESIEAEAPARQGCWKRVPSLSYAML